jgi:hypothetical protein
MMHEDILDQQNAVSPTAAVLDHLLGAFSLTALNYTHLLTPGDALSYDILLYGNDSATTATHHAAVSELLSYTYCPPFEAKVPQHAESHARYETPKRKCGSRELVLPPALLHPYMDSITLYANIPHTSLLQLGI